MPGDPRRLPGRRTVERAAWSTRTTTIRRLRHPACRSESLTAPKIRVFGRGASTAAHPSSFLGGARMVVFAAGRPPTASLRSAAVTTPWSRDPAGRCACGKPAGTTPCCLPVYWTQMPSAVHGQWAHARPSGCSRICLWCCWCVVPGVSMGTQARAGPARRCGTADDPLQPAAGGYGGGGAGGRPHGYLATLPIPDPRSAANPTELHALAVVRPAVGAARTVLAGQGGRSRRGDLRVAHRHVHHGWHVRRRISWLPGRSQNPTSSS